MKLYINTESWPRMRHIVVRYVSNESYEILFNNDWIYHSFIKYIKEMMSEHGEPYAAFVNRFSKGKLEQISEARFRESYLRSVHEGDRDNLMNRSQLKEANLKAGFYNESFYLFKAKPKKERLTYHDLTIAGNRKEIIDKGSLERRINLYEDVVAKNDRLNAYIKPTFPKWVFRN